MNVLAIDVGGTHVKILATGEKTPLKFVSGPKMTAKQMVREVKKLAAGWNYDAVSRLSRAGFARADSARTSQFGARLASSRRSDVRSR